MDKECGYCSGALTCMEGTAEGPLNASCVDGWSFNSCMLLTYHLLLIFFLLLLYIPAPSPLSLFSLFCDLTYCNIIGLCNVPSSCQACFVCYSHLTYSSFYFLSIPFLPSLPSLASLPSLPSLPFLPSPL